MALTEDEGEILKGALEEQGIQVAGASFGRAGTKMLLEGLKGKRATEYTVKPDKRDEAADVIDTPDIEEVEDLDALDANPDLNVMEGETEAPDDMGLRGNDTVPESTEVVPETAAPPPGREPASEKEMEALIKAREEQVGQPRTAPSPTPAQKAAGVVRGPINTRFYDDDGLAATVQAAAAQRPDVKTRTIQSIYDEAVKAGVPQKTLKGILSGKKMESAVGDDELAVNLAGLMSLHDVSAKKLDEMMFKMRDGELDEAGQLELREAIAQHTIIMDSLSNAKRDVARTMNVFKNVAGRDEVSIQEIRAALDNEGGEDHLRALAENYIKVGEKSGGRARKNKLLQRSFGWKVYDAMVYSAQSVLLSNPETHLYNLAANVAFAGMDYSERLISIPIGKMRQRLAKTFGKDYDADRYFMDDIHARNHAVLSGIVDGFVLMGKQLKESESVGKLGVSRNPFKSEYLFGEEIAAARAEGGLKGGALGILDALGTVYSIPFKALGAGDELIGGVVARMQLHEEAARLAKQTYDDAIEFMSSDEALELAQEAAEKLLTERPASVEQNIQDARQMLTLQGDWDMETKTGRTFWKVNKGLNKFKFMVMFNKTILKIADETAARVPGLNFMSPRFQSEWKKGGRHRDMAIARLSLGSGLLAAGYKFADSGRVTGSGPGDTNERNNLRQLGWQEFSLRFGKDEWTEDSVAKLRKVMGEDAVTFGKGQFDGMVFVSLKRLEPLNTPFLLAAAFKDAERYGAYDDGEMAEMMGPAIAALSEYSTNIPALTEISNMMSSINTRSEDNLDTFRSVVETAGRAGFTFLGNAMPVANLANSSLSAKFERILDPTVRNVDITLEQERAMYEAFDSNETPKWWRPFFQAYNRFRSRVPGLSTGVAPRLDELGDPVEAQHAALPAYVRSGKTSEVREMLAAINHFPSEPRKTMDGVVLPVELQNRYKELYAKEIKIRGKTMGQAIVERIKEKTSFYEKRNMKARIGVLQDEVDLIVSEYRSVARHRMFGIRDWDEKNELYRLTLEELPGRKYGLPGNIIEFPDYAARMRDNADQKKMRGD